MIPKVRAQTLERTLMSFTEIRNAGGRTGLGKGADKFCFGPTEFASGNQFLWKG